MVALTGNPQASQRVPVNGRSPRGFRWRLADAVGCACRAHRCLLRDCSAFTEIASCAQTVGSSQLARTRPQREHRRPRPSSSTGAWLLDRATHASILAGHSRTVIGARPHAHQRPGPWPPAADGHEGSRRPQRQRAVASRNQWRACSHSNLEGPTRSPGEQSGLGGPRRAALVNAASVASEAPKRRRKRSAPRPAPSFLQLFLDSAIELGVASREASVLESFSQGV